MGKQAKKAYLQAIKTRYQQSNKSAKQSILDEFCEVCGYARKYAIRLLNRKLDEKPSLRKRPGSKPKYQAETLQEPSRRIWLTCDQPCGKRLKAALPIWLPHYENQYGLLAESVRTDLLEVSAATLDRLLKPLWVGHSSGAGFATPLLTFTQYPSKVVTVK